MSCHSYHVLKNHIRIEEEKKPLIWWDSNPEPFDYEACALPLIHNTFPKGAKLGPTKEAAEVLKRGLMNNYQGGEIRDDETQETDKKEKQHPRGFKPTTC